MTLWVLLLAISAQAEPLVITPPAFSGAAPVHLRPLYPPPLRDGGAKLTFPPAVPVLFITHAARRYDPRAIAKPGVDKAVAHFKQKGWPIVSLIDCSGQKDSAPYVKELHATTEICSSMGEHAVDTGARPLYFAGGFFEACSLETVTRAIASALRTGKKVSELDLHYVTDAVYTDYITGLGTHTQAAAGPERQGRLRLLWHYLARDLNLPEKTEIPFHLHQSL